MAACPGACSWALRWVAARPAAALAPAPLCRPAAAQHAGVWLTVHAWLPPGCVIITHRPPHPTIPHTLHPAAPSSAPTPRKPHTPDPPRPPAGAGGGRRGPRAGPPGGGARLPQQQQRRRQRRRARRQAQRRDRRHWVTPPGPEALALDVIWYRQHLALTACCRCACAHPSRTPGGGIAGGSWHRHIRLFGGRRGGGWRGGWTLPHDGSMPEGAACMTTTMRASHTIDGVCWIAMEVTCDGGTAVCVPHQQRGWAGVRAPGGVGGGGGQGKTAPVILRSVPQLVYGRVCMFALLLSLLYRQERFFFGGGGGAFPTCRSSGREVAGCQAACERVMMPAGRLATRPCLARMAMLAGAWWPPTAGAGEGDQGWVRRARPVVAAPGACCPACCAACCRVSQCSTLRRQAPHTPRLLCTRPARMRGRLGRPKVGGRGANRPDLGE
jgi:hypothetical protein